MTYFCLAKTFIQRNTVITSPHADGLVSYKRLISPVKDRNALPRIAHNLDMITHLSISDRKNGLSGQPVDR